MDLFNGPMRPFLLSRLLSFPAPCPQGKPASCRTWGWKHLEHCSPILSCGNVENISEEVLAKIKAFDSMVFKNFARCSPVTSAARLAKQCPQKSLRTCARAALICRDALLVCHRSLLSCYNEVVREQQ